MKKKIVLGFLLLSVSILCLIEFNGVRAENIERIYSRDRYLTSIELAEKYVEKSEAIVLASGVNYPDALVGAVLASYEKCPLLLTSGSHIEDELKNYLKDENIKLIYILGGLKLINSSVEQELKQLGYEVNRLGGKDRYHTSQLVATYIEENHPIKERVFVDGRKYSDALVAGPYVVQNKGVLILNDGSPVNQGTIIGGEKSVPGKANVRIGGIDRYETAVLVNRAISANKALLVSGQDYPDALTASAYAGNIGQTGLYLLRTVEDKESLSKGLGNYKEIKIIGGPNSISKEVEALVMEVFHQPSKGEGEDLGKVRGKSNKTEGSNKAGDKSEVGKETGEEKGIKEDLADKVQGSFKFLPAKELAKLNKGPLEDGKYRGFAELGSGPSLYSVGLEIRGGKIISLENIGPTGNEYFSKAMVQAREEIINNQNPFSLNYRLQILEDFSREAIRKTGFTEQAEDEIGKENFALAYRKVLKDMTGKEHFLDKEKSFNYPVQGKKISQDQFLYRLENVLSGLAKKYFEEMSYPSYDTISGATGSLKGISAAIVDALEKGPINENEGDLLEYKKISYQISLDGKEVTKEDLSDLVNIGGMDRLGLIEGAKPGEEISLRIQPVHGPEYEITSLSVNGEEIRTEDYIYYCSDCTMFKPAKSFSFEMPDQEALVRINFISKPFEENRYQIHMTERTGNLQTEPMSYALSGEEVEILVKEGWEDKVDKIQVLTYKKDDTYDTLTSATPNDPDASPVEEDLRKEGGRYFFTMPEEDVWIEIKWAEKKDEAKPPIKDEPLEKDEVNLEIKVVGPNGEDIVPGEEDNNFGGFIQMKDSQVQKLKENEDFQVRVYDLGRGIGIGSAQLISDQGPINLSREKFEWECLSCMSTKEGLVFSGQAPGSDSQILLNLVYLPRSNRDRVNIKEKLARFEEPMMTDKIEIWLEGKNLLSLNKEGEDWYLGEEKIKRIRNTSPRKKQGMDHMLEIPLNLGQEDLSKELLYRFFNGDEEIGQARAEIISKDL